MDIYQTFKVISESNKKARKDNNYYKLLENGQALLDYIPTLIDIIVDNEHQYRKFEAEMAQKRDENGKLMSGTYCETQAKATQFYKEYRKAEMIKEWVYDSVNLAKKLAVDSDTNLKATTNK